MTDQIFLCACMVGGLVVGACWRVLGMVAGARRVGSD
jgi:hypothetical protein